MEIDKYFWPISILAGSVLVVCGFLVNTLMARIKKRSLAREAKRILSQARIQADEEERKGELAAKDYLLKARAEFEAETKERRQEMALAEKRLIQKEENIDKKVEILESREKDLGETFSKVQAKESELTQKKTILDQTIAREKEKLEKISGMTRNEAKRALIARMIDEAKADAQKECNRFIDQARENADKEAKKIVCLAIQRTCVTHTTETTCSVVNLPGDELKGRIIGREGRNVRAFEMATGVDVIIDDTPGAVILSSFDKVRREIARISLERLIEDGRIHPGRIEEVVEKVKDEMDDLIKEAGSEAVFDLGFHDMHPELIKLVGRLKYRTSYGQNILHHSKEVAYLMGIIAAELHLDSTLAKRVGLLHDIGKALTHEADGPHALLSMDLAKKYRESEEVCHAVGAHHGDIEPKSIMAALIQSCDAISAARPGARREELESYLKRLEKLEKIADSFDGVEKAYAIQAGREIRIIVQPSEVSDEASMILAKDITRKIENEVQYPGQIKAIVIRETRAVDFAK